MRGLFNLAAVFFLGCSAAFAQSTANDPLAAPHVFTCDQTTAKTVPNGSISCPIVRGTLATGETIAVHESTQPAGAVPNPAHRIQHSELIVVREGTLEFLHDGIAERAGPGSVIYVAFGTLHSVKNVGNGPVQYVVIQIGGDTKK